MAGLARGLCLPASRFPPLRINREFGSESLLPCFDPTDEAPAQTISMCSAVTIATVVRAGCNRLKKVKAVQKSKRGARIGAKLPSLHPDAVPCRLACGPLA